MIVREGEWYEWSRAASLGKPEHAVMTSACPRTPLDNRKGLFPIVAAMFHDKSAEYTIRQHSKR